MYYGESSDEGPQDRGIPPHLCSCGLEARLEYLRVAMADTEVHNKQLCDLNSYISDQITALSRVAD